MRAKFYIIAADRQAAIRWHVRASLKKVHFLVKGTVE
jgi:hypothetical protein